MKFEQHCNIQIAFSPNPSPCSIDIIFVEASHPIEERKMQYVYQSIVKFYLANFHPYYSEAYLQKYTFSTLTKEILFCAFH